MIKSNLLSNSNFLLRLRNRHFLILDAFILCVTPTIALALRIDGGNAFDYNTTGLLLYTLIALIIRLIVFYAVGLYSRYWRYASIDEMMQIISAVIVSSLLIAAIFFGIRSLTLICNTYPAACGLPRSIPLIDAMLVTLAVGATRFSVRTADVYRQRGRRGTMLQRVLIVGAGEAGALMAKEMNFNPQLGLEPIGFIDDDPHKHGARIRGLPVLGDRAALPWLAEKHKVDQVIIAMPTATGKSIREVLTICEAAGIPTKIIPGMYELLGGNVSVSQLRNVEIEDLLRRDAVLTDTAAVQALLQGKCVLVTGGGGSIGSEMCRQILRCRPAKLVIVGHGENSVFEIQQELIRKFNLKRVANTGSQTEQNLPQLVPVIADIRFPERIKNVFMEHQPQIVFHAAAHKHLPLMEQNPSEAITNNVLGTRNVLKAALAAGVERFVLISTDKAVNPTSIMGASKRAAELLVHQAAHQSGRPFVAVRFGNVLGSRGSVVLTFKQQIAAGGPVTVTAPEITRFFMTIPEAVQLVLQAAVLGKGGETFVLDMGEPVRIVDLARDLIRLSGLEVGRDIDIVFTGLNPGEKLYEELFIQGEDYQRTAHEKIFIASNASSLVPADLNTSVDALIQAAANENEPAIRDQLSHLISEFQTPAASSSENPVTQTIFSPVSYAALSSELPNSVLAKSSS
ncbi:MAG: nucleoside-diphosphate sugar epimerase/dehydratase [Anaerolineae bacterium]